MRVLTLVALVALVLLPLAAAQAADSVFSLTSSSYGAGVWTYTYLIDNTSGTDGSIFDVLLENVSDASIKETPVGWVTNPAVYNLALDGSLGWFTDAPGSYTIPVGSTSSILTGNFVITSPWGPHAPDGLPTAAFTFNENEPPGGWVEGPTYTPEPSASAVMLAGLGMFGLVGWKRRRLPLLNPCR